MKMCGDELGAKRKLDPLELGIPDPALSRAAWVLGTELRGSVRAARSIGCLAISSTPYLGFFYIGLYYVAQVGPGLANLLPQCPECFQAGGSMPTLLSLLLF